MSVGAFHKSLREKGVGSKDWSNSWTEHEYLGKNENGKHSYGVNLSTGHRVFKDKADGLWKKRKLTDERPAKDYVLIQGAKCCVEVYPYYAKYFDVHHEEVRLHEERWVVQRLFKEPDTWRNVGAWNPVMVVEETENSIVVTVTHTTDYGTLVVKYIQRDGSALKHDISFKNTSDSTETFRVLERWAGIVADKVNKEEITTPRESFKYGFIFEKEGKFSLSENLNTLIPTWEDEADAGREMWTRSGECNRCGKCCGTCHNLDEETNLCKIQETKPDLCAAWPWSPEQIEQIPECSYSFVTTGIIASPTKLKPTMIDVHPKGLKADFTYGDWTLAQNESLLIDPDIATLDDPTQDGQIKYTSGPTYVRDYTSDLIQFGGGGGGVSWSYDYRGYVEWPILTLSGGTLTANPLFKWDTFQSGTECEINPISAQPSVATDADLYADIASGVAYVNPWTVPILSDHEVDLAAAAKTSLQTAMTASQSWWAIGLQYPGGEGSIEKFGVDERMIQSEERPGVTPPPTLYVVYTPAPGWSGKISGIVDPASIMGVDKANIASVKGVA